MTNQNVVVAIFETNIVSTEQATSETVVVFDGQEFRGHDASMHEIARPYLEEIYRIVENLRIYPTPVRSADDSQADLETE